MSKFLILILSSLLFSACTYLPTNTPTPSSSDYSDQELLNQLENESDLNFDQNLNQIETEINSN